MARAKKGKSTDAAKAEETQIEDTLSASAGLSDGAGPDTVGESADSTEQAADIPSDPATDPAETPSEAPAAIETDPVETAPDAPAAGETDSVTPPDQTDSVDPVQSDEASPPPVGDDTLEAQLGAETSGMAAESGDDRIGESAAAPIAPPAAPTVVRETVVERKGGFVPMILGGAVAATIGFVAAQFTDLRLPFLPAPAEDPFVAETQTTLTQQQDRMTVVETQLSEARAALDGMDLQPVSAAIAGLEEGLAATTGAVAALEDQVAAFDSRMTALEKQPLAEAVSPEAIAAYERELEELRGAIQQQRDAVEAQRAEIGRMAEQAMASEQNAEQQAELAEIRSALAEVTALVQDGRPYAEPLAVVQAGGVEVPDALAAAGQDGVPTLAALAAEFPDVARDALREARTAGAAEEGGFATFLQNQLGARSVQPREGDDPDAVLSRAEAALKSGDLDGALAEIAKLPDQAQSVMAGWVEKAAARRDALAATGDLARRINQE